MIFYGHEISLRVLGAELVAVVFFWEHPHLPRNLLGRVGFLNQLRIALIEHDQQLFLSHYDDSEL